MDTHRHRRLLLFLPLLLCLACGDGGGRSGGDTTVPAPTSGGPNTGGSGTAAGSTNTQAGGGIGGTGISVGPITGFGSIFVNGREIFLDTETAVVVNGSQSSEQALALGQVATATFAVNGQGAAVAIKVAVDSEIDGPIDAVPAAAPLTIVGQRVAVGATTVIEDETGSPLTLAALQPGDRVEVDGERDPSGTLHATRLERRSTAGGEVEVTGRVVGLDNASQTFTLGDLTIDYSGAAVAGRLTAGLLVEVKGQIKNLGHLLASRIEAKGESPVSNGAQGSAVELDGFVTAFTSTADFAVDGVAITTTATTTTFLGGSARLAIGMRVELKGRLDGNGTVVADEIEAEDGGDGGGEE